MLLPLSLFRVSVQGQKGLKYNRSTSKAEARNWVYRTTIQYDGITAAAAFNIGRKAGNLGLCVAAISVLISVSSCRKEADAGSDRSPARTATDVIAEADTLYAGRGDL